MQSKAAVEALKIQSKMTPNKHILVGHCTKKYHTDVREITHRNLYDLKCPVAPRHQFACSKDICESL